MVLLLHLLWLWYRQDRRIYKEFPNKTKFFSFVPQGFVPAFSSLTAGLLVCCRPVSSKETLPSKENRGFLTFFPNSFFSVFPWSNEQFQRTIAYRRPHRSKTELPTFVVSFSNSFLLENECFFSDINHQRVTLPLSWDKHLI